MFVWDLPGQKAGLSARARPSAYYVYTYYIYIDIHINYEIVWVALHAILHRQSHAGKRIRNQSVVYVYNVVFSMSAEEGGGGGGPYWFFVGGGEWILFGFFGFDWGGHLEWCW